MKYMLVPLTEHEFGKMTLGYPLTVTGYTKGT